MEKCFFQIGNVIFQLKTRKIFFNYLCQVFAVLVLELKLDIADTRKSGGPKFKYLLICSQSWKKQFPVSFSVENSGLFKSTYRLQSSLLIGLILLFRKFMFFTKAIQTNFVCMNVLNVTTAKMCILSKLRMYMSNVFATALCKGTANKI